MAQYVKHNRDAKTNKKMTPPKHKFSEDEDDWDYQLRKAKKKKKLNLKQLREGDRND